MDGWAVSESTPLQIGSGLEVKVAIVRQRKRDQLGAALLENSGNFTGIQTRCDFINLHHSVGILNQTF